MENLLSEERSFPPSEEFTAQANAKPGIHEEAGADYKAFWHKQALERGLTDPFRSVSEISAQSQDH